MMLKLSELVQKTLVEMGSQSKLNSFEIMSIFECSASEQVANP